MSGPIPLTLTVNGERRTVTVHPLTRLLDVLREELRLTGTKEGCGEGECGACAVLVDGVLVVSCLVPMGQLDGAGVLTVEGLTPADAERLAPVQAAIVEAGGVQCGICTPGVVMAAHALLAAKPRPTAGDVRDALAGNICRCTGYTAICEAVLRAATDVRS
jgi:aerobic-type carbon monoxide dehydrogenase small subunit (CoxS/CutS family)